MNKSHRTDDGKPPFPTRDHPPQPAANTKIEQAVTEEALDDAIEDTFPASDPVSVDTRKTKDGN